MSFDILKKNIIQSNKNLEELILIEEKILNSKLREKYKEKIRKNILKRNNKIRVAINGFGRIGRCVFRQCLLNDDFEVVCINNPHGLDESIYLIKYDSTYGNFEYEIEKKGDSFLVKKENGNSKIKVFCERDLKKLNWKKEKVDVVFECTGVFKNQENLKTHILNGAKKVILSSPTDDKNIFYFLYGLTNKNYKNQNIVSNASCTTNSSAIILSEIDKKFGIKNCFLSTIHSVTQDQNLLDSSHKDFRRSRSGLCNIIPTTTGAAMTIGKIVKNLNGKIDGISYRVPTKVGSLSDLSINLKKNTTMKEVNDFLEKISKKYSNVIGFEKNKIVSSDIIKNSKSGVVDSLITNVINKNFLKIGIWYDNEWGFSNRMIDIAKFMFKKDKKN